jgi:hypothetical protein
MLEKSIRGAVERQIEGPAGGLGTKQTRVDLLSAAQNHSVRLLYGAAGMAAILFIVMIFFMVWYREDTAALAGLSAVFGGSIAGLITLVVKMSSSATQAGLLLALMSQLPREDALAALKAVLRADDEARNEQSPKPHDTE